MTGGASGIGAAVAAALVHAGASAVITDVDADALENTAARINEISRGNARGGKVLALQLDVTDRGAWSGAASRIREVFGGAQILFNNAGVSSRRATVGELPPELWDRLIGINLTGVFNGSRTFLSELLPRGEPGHIVNTGSMCGLLSVPMLGAYVASKFAVVGLSETMRLELAERSVGVSVLCPGFVSTNIVRNSVRSGPDGDATYDDERRGLADRLRAAMPAEEVAVAVLDAIARNLPYVITHPEYEEAVGSRSGLIAEAFERATSSSRPDVTAALGAAWVERRTLANT